MSVFFSLTVALALFAGTQSIELEGTSRGGAKWRVLPGNKAAKCQVQDCEISVTREKSITGCALACSNRLGCRCAIYRASDNYCSFKKYKCNSWKVGLEKDLTGKHFAIDVDRPAKSPPPHVHQAPQAPQLPLPSVSAPTPSPSVPEPTPSPSAPKPTPPPASVPVPIGRGGEANGALRKSTMTIFHGFGIPYGGCGVPMEDMYSGNKLRPYVALNVNAPGGQPGLFQGGANCGRWLKITVGTPCGTPNDGSNIGPCLANFDAGVSDGKDGTVIYGYVADSCADTNAWCVTDVNHVDMGIENMEANGLATNWQNNRIEWSFMDGAPPGWNSGPMEWRWCKDSKMDWLCIIAVNIDNGIDRVEVQMLDGSWKSGWKNWILGQQWNLPGSNEILFTDGKMKVQAFDIDQKSYGIFSVGPPQGVPKVTVAN